jgi:hypothetical protein
VIEEPERVRFIEHRGVRLLYHDFSGVRETRDALERITLARRKAGAEAPKSVRALVDVRGSHFNPQVTRALQELAAHNKPFVVASAIVGATRLHRIIIYAVARFSGRTFATFDALEAAQDWLVEQREAS